MILTNNDRNLIKWLNEQKYIDTDDNEFKEGYNKMIQDTVNKILHDNNIINLVDFIDRYLDGESKIVILKDLEVININMQSVNLAESLSRFNKGDVLSKYYVDCVSTKSPDGINYGSNCIYITVFEC